MPNNTPGDIPVRLNTRACGRCFGSAIVGLPCCLNAAMSCGNFSDELRRPVNETPTEVFVAG